MNAEFDAYAADYDGGQDNRLKRLLGTGHNDFIDLKAAWLTRRDWFRSAESVLDYGCGTGVLLSSLARFGSTATFDGCDVSEEMLAQASELPEVNSIRPIEIGHDAPFETAGYDVVIISAVLHHIPPAERPRVFADLFRLTKPGGRVVIFEHNPLNPATQWVVRRTPIDHDAILLSASESRRGLLNAGFSSVTTRNIMFFPPRFRGLWKAEEYLGRIPFGGQYVVSAQR